MEPSSGTSAKHRHGPGCGHTPLWHGSHIGKHGAKGRWRGKRGLTLGPPNLENRIPGAQKGRLSLQGMRALGDPWF
jgi:hypothetical protein